MVSKILITGGAGRIGSFLCPALLRAGHQVTSVDLRAHEDTAIDSRCIDLADRVALAPLLSEHDALIHLAAHPDSRDWDALETLNLRATRTLFEDAAAAGIRRILFASSIHIAGFLPWDARFTTDTPIRPDSPYGVSKAFGEAMLRFVHETHGIAAYALRIGTCRHPPQTRRERYTWISSGDLTRLVLACLDHAGSGYHALWGFSANRAADINRAAWNAVGYAPQDDAEDHLPALAEHREDDGEGFGRIGGRFIQRTAGSAREAALG